MDKEALERAYTAQIIAGITAQRPTSVSKMECVELPEDIKQYKQPDVGKFRVSVGYDMSEYKKIEDMRLVTQDEEITMIITIQSRKLRDADIGIYRVHDWIEKSIIGFTPENCKRQTWSVYFGPPKTMEPRIEDTWLYEYHVKTTAVSVQDLCITEDTVTPSYKGFTASVVNGDAPLIIPESVIGDPNPIISLKEA